MKPGDSFRLGKYTVRLGMRRDNPAFPVFEVFIGHVMIGKSFSRVDEGACRWLERQQRDQTGYAYSTENLSDKPYGFTAVHHYLHYKVRRSPRKPEPIADIKKVLVVG